MENNNNFLKPEVPNAQVVLILGIVSLALEVVLSCLGFGVFGFVASIIGFILSNGAKKEITANPEKYSEKSIKSLKTGRILNIIGLVLGILTIVFAIILFAAGGLAALMQQ